METSPLVETVKLSAYELGAFLIEDVDAAGYVALILADDLIAQREYVE